MSRSRMIVLMMVVLALVAIGHHQLVSRNMKTDLVPAAEAASLQASSGAGDSCTGTGTWHFVNPQSGGICAPLTVTFSCGQPVTQTQEMCLNNNNNYANITTHGSCTLLDANNDPAQGKIVLSSFSCVSATPTPTPSPTP